VLDGQLQVLRNIVPVSDVADSCHGHRDHKLVGEGR
jgi:hypothetical protein